MELIFAVCLDSTVEKVYMLESWIPEALNEARAVESFAGGTAIRMARVTLELGEQTQVSGLAGGANGRILAELLDREHMEHDLIAMSGETRQALTIQVRGDASFRLIDPPPALDITALARLEQKVAGALQRGAILLLSGEQPPGFPEDYCVRLLQAARAAGVPAVLSAGGSTLASGLEGRPYLFHISRGQMEAMLGRPDCPMDGLIEGAIQVAMRGIEVVVLSLGSEGMVAAWGNEVFYAAPPGTVAAGQDEALTAGLAVGLARRWGPEETIRTALASVAASAMSDRPGRLRLIDVEALWEQVHIERI